MSFQSIDPSTGTLIGDYSPYSSAELERRVAAAAEAQRAFRTRSVEQRCAVLRRAGELLRERAEELAVLATAEMGKPLREARAEVAKCAAVCDYYADTAALGLADREVTTEAEKSYVCYAPLGLVLAIMPWNFPYWQVFRFAAPTLAAGNGVLLKHAPNVCGAALAIEQLWLDAGLVPGLFQTLLIEEDRAQKLIADPRVAAVTLTGSTRAGRAVAAAAGAAIKKTVLELGGSDPYVVLPDADLERALEACVAGRLLNGGQSCIAAKRFIVCAPLVERFTAGVLERFRGVRSGDPRDDSVQLGPIAREDLRAALHMQVEDSVAAGARLLCGGQIPDGPGWHYPATLLGDVRPGMAAFDQELFGPVGVVIHARNEEEAFELAGRTAFGLGAAVFTADVAKGERLAREVLHAGAVFVNDFVRSDPRLPFGGVGESGYGRELSREGLHEFVNVKTIVVA